MLLFESVLPALRAGKKARRKLWDDSWLHIEILTKGSIPEIYLLTAVGMEWPYPNRRSDLLATDWEILDASA